MAKLNSPYDYGTDDIAAEIAHEIDMGYLYKSGLDKDELIAIIKRELDKQLLDGKLRVYTKRHHVTV